MISSPPGASGSPPGASGSPLDAPGSPLEPYAALLLVGFGGPERPEEVVPFLESVTRGRGIPKDRLEAVAEHYIARGGVSPINAETRALRAALEGDLHRRGIEGVPVLWGNRHLEPSLTGALAEASEAGAGRVLAILTSGFSSYSSCRQYRENLASAAAEVDLLGLAVPDIDKVRPYALSEGVLAAWTDRLVEGLRERPAARVLFVTHSIPEAMDETSGPGDGEGNLYVDQHLRLASAVVARAAAALGVAPPPHDLVFCSRSGPAHVPWLEPDVNDRLRELAAEGVSEVILAPIGFISDHMEVVHDLDTEAAATATEVGVGLTRLPTLRTHPAFVAGLVDLALERAAQARGEDPPVANAVAGDVRPAVCAPGCCPNLREWRPALCGAE